MFYWKTVAIVMIQKSGEVYRDGVRGGCSMQHLHIVVIVMYLQNEFNYIHGVQCRELEVINGIHRRGKLDLAMAGVNPRAAVVLCYNIVMGQMKHGV